MKGTQARELAVDLVPGTRFPDLDLPDHTGRPRTLFELSGGDPMALIASGGWWCPKEQRDMRELYKRGRRLPPRRHRAHWGRRQGHDGHGDQTLTGQRTALPLERRTYQYPPNSNTAWQLTSPGARS